MSLIEIEREKFVEKVGLSPEEYLSKYKNNEITLTIENTHYVSWAWLITKQEIKITDPLTFEIDEG